MTPSEEAGNLRQEDWRVIGDVLLHCLSRICAEKVAVGSKRRGERSVRVGRRALRVHAVHCKERKREKKEQPWQKDAGRVVEQEHID